MDGIRPLQHLDQDAAIWLVLVALTALLLHHLALGVDPLLIHPGMEHAFALQPEPELKLIAGQHLVVVGAIAVGVRVQHTAGLLHVLAEFPATDVRRSLEEQMLEEVGESAPVSPLILAAHVVHHAHRHDRGAVVLMHDDVKAVVKVELRERDGAFLRCERDGEHWGQKKGGCSPHAGRLGCPLQCRGHRAGRPKVRPRSATAGRRWSPILRCARRPSTA